MKQNNNTLETILDNIVLDIYEKYIPTITEIRWLVTYENPTLKPLIFELTHELCEIEIIKGMLKTGENKTHSKDWTSATITNTILLKDFSNKEEAYKLVQYLKDNCFFDGYYYQAMPESNNTIFPVYVLVRKNFYSKIVIEIIKRFVQSFENS